EPQEAAASVAALIASAANSIFFTLPSIANGTPRAAYTAARTLTSLTRSGERRRPGEAWRKLRRGLEARRRLGNRGGDLNAMRDRCNASRQRGGLRRPVTQRQIAAGAEVAGARRADRRPGMPLGNNRIGTPVSARSVVMFPVVRERGRRREHDE